MNDAALAVEGTDPALSPDGRSLYYTTEGDIYRSIRNSVEVAFRGGAPLDGVNTPDRLEGDPFVSRDGKTLYFDTDREGDYQIYYANIVTLPADKPIPLGEVNMDILNEMSPVVSKDNLTIYFASTRNKTTHFEIWVATRKFESDGFGRPTRVEIGTDGHDYPEALSDDGCTLWYSTAWSGFNSSLFALRTPH